MAGYRRVTTWKPCGLFFSLLLVVGCSQAEPAAEQTGPPATDAAPADPPALVSVQEARRALVRPKVLALGTVRARDISVVASAADGVVDKYELERGDFVTEDQILSELRMKSTNLDLDEQRAVLEEREAEYQEILHPRQEDVDEAKARREAAQASVANASRRLEELRALGQRGAANASTIKDAEDMFEEQQKLLLAANAVFQRVSQGAREELKAQVKARLEAQQKHVEFLEAEAEKRITRAPFSGFIVQEHCFAGEWLSKGAPVVTLADLSEVDVEVQVDQTFISQVQPGDAVDVSVAGAVNQSTGDEKWPGVVHRIVLRSDWEAGSRSFPVIVRIRNEWQQIRPAADAGSIGNPSVERLPVLREGMMAEVQFYGRPIDAMLVPKDALVRSNRGTVVYAVDKSPDGNTLVARSVPVETGLSEEGWIQVTCDGIDEGTQVVTVGGERLRPFKTLMLQDAGGAGSGQEAGR